MGIFSCLTLLCVCLLFLSFSLSLGRLAGAARSGSACCCAKWRLASWWVWLSVFFCVGFFFLIPFPSYSPPPLVLRLRSEPRRRPSQEGGGTCVAANRRGGRAGPACSDWLALTSSCSRGSRSWAGLGSCRGRLVQREKTGAMIPAPGRTSRAGDPRRAGEKGESRARPWGSPSQTAPGL